MKKLIKENKVIIFLCLGFFLIGGICLLLQHKGEMVLWANDNRSHHLSVFFRYATWIGGGTGMVLIIFSLLFFQVRYFLVLAIVNIWLGIVVQFLKRVVFADSFRPLIWFDQQGIKLNYIEGFHPGSYFSFPSGHAASAFGLFITLAILIRAKAMPWIFFICALIVIFSRVYLGQHFFQDVYAGAMLAFLSLIPITSLVTDRKWYQSSWASKPIWRLFKEK